MVDVRNHSVRYAYRAWQLFNKPVLRGVFIFILIMSLFYGFVHSPDVELSFFSHHLRLIASITGSILSALGYETTVSESTISTPQMTLQIVRGCDAIEPTVAFIAAVIASPVSSWSKIPGIFIGSFCLYLINLGRIVSLFFIGIYSPQIFKVVHESIWQALIIILAIVFWAYWVRWATRKPRGPSKNATS